MPLTSREAKNAYQRDYYAKNKDHIGKQIQGYSQDRKIATRKWLAAIKSVPCMDCGVSYDPFVMDFDHVRGVKEFHISQACTRGISLERIKAEIKKCDLVCSNCHRIRTLTRHNKLANPRNTEPGKRFYKEKKLKTQCIHGHELTPENTRTSKGKRKGCRTCFNEQQTARRKAKRCNT